MNLNAGRSLAALFAMVLMSLVVFTAPGLSQSEPPSPVEEAQRELEQIQSSLADGRARADQLRREIEQMSDDRAQQNAALIAAAQRVKLAEIEVEAMEERVNALIDEEAEVRARLDGADTDISSLLASLQRIGRSPPPALLVKPSDALGSARGAMLMAAALPQLRSRADAVIDDLGRMVDIRKEAETEQEALNANYATLFEEQLRIAVLIEARKQGVSRNNDALSETELEAERLANRSSSLTQLIDTLANRMSAASEAVSRLGHENIDGISPEDIRLALADTSRTEPALPFSLIRGYLAQPVFGVTVTGFAGDDGMGGVSNGLSIVTRAEADVVAPSDGWVSFAGEYLNYGKIVILDAGDGYSILLAGLDVIDASPGQFVRLGEKLGRMGSRTIGRAVTTSAGVSRPTLYIEIRDENGSIDPTGWWANQNRTQSG
jgi:septal ring factor EnvC (AmiA/AmiB activator)